MTDLREQLKSLILEKERLEDEANSIASELNFGENQPGLHTPLVDAEGFPRADIDILAVRMRRRKLSEINTDHKNVMLCIESALRDLHAVQPPPGPPSNGSEICVEVKPYVAPIAIIRDVIKGSPAHIANLKPGFIIFEFDEVNFSSGQNHIELISANVHRNEGRSVTVVYKERIDGDLLNTHVSPRRWEGSGLLGCQFSPLL